MSHNLDSARNTSAINLSGMHRQNQGDYKDRKEYRTDTYATSEHAEDGLPLGVFLYKNYRYVYFLLRCYGVGSCVLCSFTVLSTYHVHRFFLSSINCAYFLFSNRSHRRILEVPSALFYGGALQECADPAQVNSLCGWDKLPQTEGGSFPLLMIGELIPCTVLLYCR